MSASIFRLYRLGGYVAILGGALNILSSFIPFTENSPLLEFFYLLIDLSLLFGLLAIYAYFADQLGTQGFIAFIIATAAVASIVGPESEAFDLDWYILGSGLLLMGMAGLGLSLLERETLIPSACCWIGALILAMSAAFFKDPYTTAAAGSLFGCGFVLAGYELVSLLRDRESGIGIQREIRLVGREGYLGENRPAEES